MSDKDKDILGFGTFLQPDRSDSGLGTTAGIQKYSKGDMKKGYKHYVAPAPQDPNFPSGYQFILVTSLDMLYSLLNQPFEYMSFDTETTGFDPTREFIVGFSFSFDGVASYYVPVEHHMGGLGFEALQCVYDRMLLCKLVLMYNARFDMRFMEYEYEGKSVDLRRGEVVWDPVMVFDFSKIRYFDVQAALWLADTNFVYPSLKSKYSKSGKLQSMGQEERFLGWVRSGFTDTLAGVTNFYYTDYKDPKVAFYAGGDALSTYRLAFISMKYHKESGLAGKVDQELIYPLMKMEETNLYFDIAFYESTYHRLLSDISRLEESIYGHAGVTFNINSDKQRESVFLSLGIDTGVYTPTGMMSTGGAVLKEYIKNELSAGREVSKFITDLVEHIAKRTQLNNFYGPMVESLRDYPNGIRLRYNTVAAATGRLSCGGSKDDSYYLSMNMQALPKAKSHMWFVREADETSNPLFVLGKYEYTYGPRADSVGWVEGMDYPSFRSGLKMHDGWVLVEMDYSAVELRIAANMSNETHWIDTFNAGEDFHRNVAVNMWGEEEYNNDKRRLAKAISFGILYGQSPFTFAKRNRITVEAAKEYFDRYHRGAPNLTAWIKYTQDRALSTGSTYTPFGRPRRVAHYVSTGNRSDIGFAKRIAVNSPIQGGSADVTRLALIRLYKNLLTNPKYEGKVWFVSTIHDSFSVLVCEEMVAEVSLVMKKCLEIEIRTWGTQLKADIEVGRAWGATFPFEVSDSGELTPIIDDLPHNFGELLANYDIEVENFSHIGDDDVEDEDDDSIFV